MACQWISLWLSPSRFGSFLTAPTISVYTGVLLGSFYSPCIEIRTTWSWFALCFGAFCARVRRKRRRSGRWISSTIIYLTHIHGRGRGSYLVITSSFVFGNLLLRFLSSWLLLRRGSGVALNGKWGGSGIWDLEDSFDSNGRRRGRMRISTTIVGMGAAAGVSCELSRSKAAGP